MASKVEMMNWVSAYRIFPACAVMISIISGCLHDPEAEKLGPGTCKDDRVQVRLVGVDVGDALGNGSILVEVTSLREHIDSASWALGMWSEVEAVNGTAYLYGDWSAEMGETILAKLNATRPLPAAAWTSLVFGYRIEHYKVLRLRCSLEGDGAPGAFEALS